MLPSSRGQRLGTLSRSAAAPYKALLWSDEFNGAAGSAPDPTKWGITTGRGWGGNTTLYYMAPNAVLDGNSNLALTLKNETTPDSKIPPDAQAFTGGWVASLIPFGFGTYPLPLKIVYRAQIPWTTGIWPGLWTEGVGDGASYAAWPARGELDVVEVNLGNAGRRSSNIHMGTIGTLTTQKQFSLGGESHDNDWHIYGYDWYADHVNLHYDGRIMGGVTQAAATAGSGDWKAFDGSAWGHYLKANIACGLPGSVAPDATSVWPKTMLVDWIRVYAL